MIASRLGELAALLTAVLWAFTALYFTLASTRVGVLAVNRTRLVFAVLLLGATHLLFYGTLLPLSAPLESWLWLGLSGLIGPTLGDSFLFQSYIELGPRKATLIMSSWPIFSALMGIAFLGEALTWLEFLGILVTLAGISWVVLERSPTTGPVRNGRLGRGTAFALGGALCQAAGLVAAKEGLREGVSSLSGTLIRMVVATLGILIVTVALGGVRESFDKLRDRRALLYTACGAATGPFVGVWLSLYAVSHAKVGVASALMAPVPVLLLPLVWIFFKERISRRAFLGTLVAFMGVALLLLEN